MWCGDFESRAQIRRAAWVSFVLMRRILSDERIEVLVETELLQVSGDVPPRLRSALRERAGGSVNMQYETSR